MVNEATKRAIVTEMSPPELAAHLKLNADRYNTYARMTWQVLRSVNLKLPSQPCVHGESKVLMDMSLPLPHVLVTQCEFCPVF